MSDCDMDNAANQYDYRGEDDGLPHTVAKIKIGDKVQQVGFLGVMSSLEKNKIYTVLDIEPHKSMPMFKVDGVKDWMCSTNFKVR